MRTEAKRILIVDDEPLILEVLALQFTTLGLDCQTATTPERALEILNEFHPDIIVSDFMMSSIDGLDLLERVRDQGLQTPFFLMTGYSDRARAKDRETLRLSGMIEKPFRLSELKTLISRVVDFPALHS